MTRIREVRPSPIPGTHTAEGHLSEIPIAGDPLKGTLMPEILTPETPMPETHTSNLHQAMEHLHMNTTGDPHSHLLCIRTHTELLMALLHNALHGRPLHKNLHEVPGQTIAATRMLSCRGILDIVDEMAALGLSHCRNVYFHS